MESDDEMQLGEKFNDLASRVALTGDATIQDGPELADAASCEVDRDSDLKRGYYGKNFLAKGVELGVITGFVPCKVTREIEDSGKKRNQVEIVLYDDRPPAGNLLFTMTGPLPETFRYGSTSYIRPRRLSQSLTRQVSI